MFLNVNNREIATILASLRYWQRNDRQTARKAPEYEIATDSGDVRPLGDLEIDELCERINGDDPLPGAMLAALERASAACGDEIESEIQAAYAAGLGPQVSWPLKRLLMAEIENEESPPRLETVAESLVGGYRPYNRFPVAKVKRELDALIRRAGNAPAARFVTADDWKRRAKGE